LHRRRIQKKGRAQGVEVDFKVHTPKLDACVGSIECFGLIAIIAVGIVATIGIAFPIQITQSAEDAIITWVMIGSGVGLGIVTPLLLCYGFRWDFANHRKALERALAEKGISSTTQKQIEHPKVCSTCGKPTIEGGKFCEHCGAALNLQ
jgi:hypothetical protein